MIGGQASPKRDGAKEGYGGAYPGILEEAWWWFHPPEGGTALPLYVAGGFGGAAGGLADLFLGRPAPAALLPDSYAGPEYSEFRARAAELAADPDRPKLGVPADLSQMVQALRDDGRRVLADDEASTAWNGLSRDENLELLQTRDPVALSRLVMRGLLRRSLAASTGKLRIELVRGSVTQVRGVDLVAVPVMRNVPVGGAGAALDVRLSSRVSTALREKELLVAIPSQEVDADWLALADLGVFGPDLVETLPDRVEQAARKLGAVSLQHGFRTVGLVSIGGGLSEDRAMVVDRMVRGLRAAADHVAVQWMENEDAAFRGIAQLLAGRDDVALTTRELVPEGPAAQESPDRDTLVTVRYGGDKLHTTILPPARTAVAMAIEAPLPPERFAKLTRADLGGPPANVASIGEELAKEMFGPRGLALLESLAGHRIVLQHDQESAGLPFEAMGLPGKPFAVQGGLVRRPALEDLSAIDLTPRPPRVGALKIALVVDPTDDLCGTREEAAALKAALAATKVEVHRELVGSAATKAAVIGVLQDPAVDVVHYAGHAFYDGPGREGSGLVCADDRLLARDLVGLEITARMVFFNACEAGRVRASTTVASPEVNRAMAEQMLRSRLEAYLGTYWPVGDAGAATFATEFYRRLATGETVDGALRGARRDLYARSSVEWANYVFYGDGRYRLVGAE